VAVAFRILFVCTGNLCRSALAEWYLRGRVDSGAAVVASAGVHAPPGYAMDPPTAQALRELGADGGRHLSRRLVAEHVRDADLVLGAAVSHRDSVLRLVPGALNRTFALKEFLRLAGQLDSPPRAPGELVKAVAGQRGRAVAAPEYADDIGDPFGFPIEVARLRAAETARAVDALVDLLGFSSPVR
jgi:protein-tyrosine phosphatase